MSSAPEHHAGRGLLLRLTLVNVAIVGVASVLMWMVAFAVVRESLAEDWRLKRSQVRQSLAVGDSGESSVQHFLSEDFVLLSLPPAARKRLEDHVVEQLPLFLGLVLLVALGAGWWIAFRSLRPLRSLAARAHEMAREEHPQRLSRLYPDRGDLTDLAELLDELLAKNRSLVRAMHESLDHIGHDLRTPMARMRAIAEQALSEGEDARAREALATCVEESDQVLRLLATLVDLSRAESGDLVLRTEPTDVGELLESVRDLYELVAEEARVELRVDAPAGLVMALDPVRIREAIANCVDNAIKHGPADDVVFLRARPLADGGVRFEIEDHGEGIPPADLPLIWERLFRGDRARTSPGLGLGLSLVKAIVDAHRGSVDASSRPGRTVIELMVPGDPGATRPPAAGGSPASAPETRS